MIVTDRFIIDNISLRDAKDLKEIFEDFSKGEYWMYDYPVSLSDENILKLTIAFSLQETFYGVYTPDRKKMMGYISFDGEGGEFEMGYSFHSLFHGKGLAYDACREIMEYLQREYVVRKFTAGTALDNLPSVRLLDKLGFTMTGTEELAFHKDISGNPIKFTGGIYEKDCRK